MNHFLQQRNNRIFIDSTGRITLSCLETYFAYGCNLQCGFCGNMSPFSCGMEPAEKVMQSMREWGKRLKPGRFIISGGESLLHPDFARLIVTASECFPDSKIEAFTNGILLDRLSERDLKMLQGRLEFRIEDKDISNQENIDRQCDRLEKHGVACSRNSRRIFRKLYDIDDVGMPVPSNSNPAAAWSRCYCIECVNIIGDTLTYCSRMALLRRDYNLGNIDKSWYRVNGHQPVTLANSRQEVLDYLHKGYHPECALCPEQQPEIGLPKQISETERQYIRQRITPKSDLTPPITAENTIFVSVAAYPNPEEKCDNFIRSAEKFEVPIRWLSWGEQWRGFNYHKMRVFREYFDGWRKEGIEYVFMLDSKDVVFADDLETILRKANDIYEPETLLFNDEFEKHFYPYKDEHYKAVLLSQGVLLNSGMILGHIDTYETVIGYALEIIDGIKNGTPRAGIATHFYNDEPARIRMIEDDQLTYQMCSIYYPQYFRVDQNRYLLAWVRLLKGELLEDLRREKITKGCVGQASIIHSSSTISWGGQHVWDRWVAENELV